MIDPKSTPRNSNVGSKIIPVSTRRKAHPWAWIVGLIVVLLLIWGFFGMDHLKPDVNPATSPAAATSVAD